jgi:hypothetical protein
MSRSLGILEEEEVEMVVEGPVQVRVREEERGGPQEVVDVVQVAAKASL